MRTQLTLAACAITALALTGTQLAGEDSTAQEEIVVPPRPAPSKTIATTTTTPKRVYASSSDLPDGGQFAVSGTGGLRVVPGSSAVAGTGPLRTYTVELENGVDEPDFARFVEETLADPRGWTATGERSVRRVDSGPASFKVRLVSQQTARAVCGYDIPVDVSCHVSGVVYLSAARWVRGAVAYDGDLVNYRRYMVNHEVGHAFGQPHRPCMVHGGPAPTMMQQSFSTANNEIVEITAGVPQGAVIPADGKVCAPNPWPYV